MNKQKIEWIIPAVLIIAFGELVIDALTPIGTADYIFYFLPVALTVLHHKKNLPLYTAALSSVLICVGYFISPEGTNQSVAGLNRIFASSTIWIVAYMVRMIIAGRLQVEENDWVKSGVNLSADRIRGELDTPEIGTHIFDFLTDYVGIKAGALYLYDDQKKVLKFTTGYAFFPNENRQEIVLGDGLLGQAALDRKPKELKKVPMDYFKVSSSMGEKPAESVVVYPLVADNKLIGGIELAIHSHQMYLVKILLNQLIENLAIALRSSQARWTLQAALNQSQQLSEELQAQQEELRVTNEELEQQSKALKESHLKMENQQAELEQTNQQLEEQAQLLENQKITLDEKNKYLLNAQTTLEEKSNEIAKTSQYKSEFLANMSHELRTPLNSTLILAKLLSENKPGTMTEEQKKYAEIIYTSGNDLLNLINDILDLSKVEAGKMVATPEIVEVESIKKNLEAMFRAQAETKGIEFKVEVEPLVPMSIITDRFRLDQILKNFLSNAFKFTDKGFVQLQIYREPRGLSFAISDSGIGIPQEQQDVIFEAFRQADGTSNRKYGGTGLGLSISKELAHLLNGEITVKSAVGEGSTFILTIPLELIVEKEKTLDNIPKIERAHKEQTETTPASLVKFDFEDDRDNLTKNSRKILIIEDDETFAKILLDLAREMKFSAILAPTAEEGLRLAQHHMPHAVLLDMRLPDHSGLLVLDQLKMNAKTRHIPVHVISSSDFSKSAMEMGAIGYMHKPVKREQLQSAFNNLTSLMSAKEKHVLVVEDDAVQRMHITDLITDEYVKVDAVETAMDALSKLANKTYDCMIMDLSLPDLSGYELLSKLSNESDNYSYPPVIVYTARDLTREEEEKLRQYSGSIIIKGAKSPERLLSEVTLFLHRVETELPPERQKMLKDLRNREKTLEDRKILVVDDDVRNIFALTSALENYGAKIHVARNGREAIDKIMTTPELDLVLMDIMMPEMDGYEAMRKLRMNKKFDSLPIIALTAKAMKDDQEKCLEAGANDYLPKPINVDKLLSLIRVWLPNQRSFLS